jgi:hypothetical protein
MVQEAGGKDESGKQERRQLVFIYYLKLARLPPSVIPILAALPSISKSRFLDSSFLIQKNPSHVVWRTPCRRAPIATMAEVLGPPHAHRIPARSAQKWASAALE